MSDLLTALRSGSPVLAAELRPPRAELAAGEGMNAWIDTYHAVKRLTKSGTYVFLTDSAVGAQEEDNLRHLVTNLGHDVPRDRIVPFLTSKHTLEYCYGYAERARQHGFPSLVVLGGDKAVGTPRVVEHAWKLRHLLRERTNELTLGGWANPHADAARQVDFLVADNFCAEYFLTQVVSHHDASAVERFVGECERRRVALPGIYGVFYYRSANLKTLKVLSDFLPVPIDGLTQDFSNGATPEDVCARTLRALRDAGARHFYISNLPLGRAPAALAAIIERASV